VCTEFGQAFTHTAVIMVALYDYSVARLLIHLLQFSDVSALPAKLETATGADPLAAIL
jgi:hypothetical protein